MQNSDTLVPREPSPIRSQDVSITVDSVPSDSSNGLKTPNHHEITPVDILIKLMNLKRLYLKPLILIPRHFSNFRYANIHRDAFELAEHLAEGQFCKIYGRVTLRYKYHPLQRFENLLRCFNVIPDLAAQMELGGNLHFYQAVCEAHNVGAQFNHNVDLTKIDAVMGLHSSGRYLYEQLQPFKGTEAAELARDCYMRGFSRVVQANDYNDWEALRNELRKKKNHVVDVDLQSGSDANDVLLFALSYKQKDEKISRRMQIKNDDGEIAEDGGVTTYSETVERTSHILDDFRWSQVVRSCMTYAKMKGKGAVRIWVDHLVMSGLRPAEIRRRYDVVDWEDFGLFAYAVCPVVRVYGKEEVEYNTEFWRKLEAVLGVAGRGLIVDDYMLQTFDSTIHYGPALYTRLPNGLSIIGGSGVYVRNVTLAWATAILTDALSVTAANEDIRTKRDIIGWKSWALRTIAEGAYSSKHSMTMRSEEPFEMSVRDFKVISLWESLVSRSPYLTGKSYMDMSLLRSKRYTKSGHWDGVIEWAGMMHGSCVIKDRAHIEEYLNSHVGVEMYVATTGHVASLMSLVSPDGMHKRTLAVDLARFSTAKSGQVTAVAEATGLFGKDLAPWYMRYVPDPDRDQEFHLIHHELYYTLNQMKIDFVWNRVMRWLVVVTVIGLMILLAQFLIRVSGIGIILVMLELVVGLYFLNWFFEWINFPWPWVDKAYIGEALFHNLLMHGLFKAGIKKQYRRMKYVSYNSLRWV